MFRGEKSSETNRPDGKGFKQFANGSIYEGWFNDGQTNGFGRGITPDGEIY